MKILKGRCRECLDPDGLEFIEHATDAVRRMQALIGDLHIYTNMDRTKTKVEVVDCERELGRVIRDLSVLLKEVGAEVTNDPLPRIWANSLHIYRLFSNLITNAIKYRGMHNPKIHISSRKSGHGRIFSVRDNGIGIDPQDMERIFEPFQRLRGRRGYSGAGIGLAICRKIVEAHGGRIWVESEPGKGSIFYFTLNEVDRKNSKDP